MFYSHNAVYARKITHSLIAVWVQTSSLFRWNAIVRHRVSLVCECASSSIFRFTHGLLSAGPTAGVRRSADTPVYAVLCTGLWFLSPFSLNLFTWSQTCVHFVWLTQLRRFCGFAGGVYTSFVGGRSVEATNIDWLRRVVSICSAHDAAPPDGWSMDPVWFISFPQHDSLEKRTWFLRAYEEWRMRWPDINIWTRENGELIG